MYSNEFVLDEHENNSNRRFYLVNNNDRCSGHSFQLVLSAQGLGGRLIGGGEMKALSIQQPWAWAIINGGKDIENRSWYTGFRGRVLIHTGKKFDKDECSYIQGVFGISVPTDLPTGGIVGSVEIIDCVKESKSKWFFGEYGFVLRNPISLPFMPYRGQLGFFDVEYNQGGGIVL